MDPIYVKDYNSGASACAVEINASYNGEFYFVANNAVPYTNNGDALRIGQCAFNIFKGSYSIANNGVNFAAGYSYGNEFSAVDIEDVLYGIAVGSDASNTGANYFSGGTVVFNLGMVNQTTTHGYNSLIFDGTNYAPNLENAPIIAPGSIATGIVFRGQDIAVTPILPASGVPVENTQGMDILVTINDQSGHSDLQLTSKLPTLISARLMLISKLSDTVAVVQ
jgi:hypothetical protein